MPKLRPFITRSSDNPRCHLIAGVGLCWGRRGAPESSGAAAIWLFSNWRLHRRTQRADGYTEHFKRGSFWLEAQGGKRLARVILESKGRPRFEFAAV